MFSTRIHVELETLLCTNTPLVYASINPTTGLLGTCAGDGCILLSNISCLGATTSAIHLDMEHVSRFVWLNNYDIAVVGSGGCLKLFSIMNLEEATYKVHGSGISTAKHRNNLLCTGSSDGTVTGWDLRTKKAAFMFPHKIRNQTQPIKDVDMEGCLLYSTSLYKGCVWAWDIRNPKKSINRIETESCQNHVLCHAGVAYTAGSNGLRRTSATLQETEMVIKIESNPYFEHNTIAYNERFDVLVVGLKEGLFVKHPCTVHKINQKDKEKYSNELHHSQIANPGFLGFELFNTSQILGYQRNGTVKMGTLKKCIESLNVLY